MNLKTNLLLMAVFMLSTSAVLSSSINTLYDCPSMSDYSQSLLNPEKQCKNSETYGMTKQECYDAVQKDNALYHNEYNSGQCKDIGHRIIEGQYNTTNRSMKFITSPYPKIYSHGYSNKNGFGYGSGDDPDGAKCLDTIYRELKSKYPNIQR